MNARAGRSCSQDAAFKFDGAGSDGEVRAVAAALADIYQPGLRALLATLGRDDVQDRLARLGVLEPRAVDESFGRSR
jgi:hypothetical protein